MLDTSRSPLSMPRIPVGLRVWRNPLARPGDRCESLLVLFLVALWALAAPIIAVAGSAAWPGISERIEHDRSGVVAVDAVLVTGTPPPPTRMSMPVDHAAVAQWTDRSGATVQGPVTVPSGSMAGGPVQVWLAQDGSVVPQPMTPTTACVLLVVSAFVAWLVLGGLLAGVLSLGRRALDRGRYRQWAQEWALVNAGGRPWTP
ncbi:hypothetical protein FDO65_06170 [Nakamurella flava]|uniref:Uncharacterized protein n=1 Tax=Nakamurella flava TaxID=2576308 RepID=A0A4V6Y6T4_9ACTN|nr:hypothetical protein [Nakamurella flava]TKV61205.1 hypothetical protein FDO65_06170 [Nakamurella flava]